MKKKLIAIAVLTVFLSLVFVLRNSFQNYTLADASYNVSGWAWSENIGWISFNSSSGGGSVNYGVNIDPDGAFSGYAWSENIGWVDFASARMDISSGQVSGWARVLANGGGWDGWIKLAGDGANWNSGQARCAGINNYNNTNQCDWGVRVDMDQGAFSGWAWSDQVVGWIDFSRARTAFSFNAAPTAATLPADSPNSTDYCGISGYPPVRVSWVFQDQGDTQTAFQIKVTGPGGLIDTGKISGGSGSYIFQNAGEQLSFETSYNWQMRVWDSQDKPSAGWINGPSFTTISHAYPNPDFSWSPQNPGVKELIQFTNDTIFYGNPGGQSRSWDFGDGASSLQENPSHAYSQAGQKQVLLQSSDDAGSCSKTKTINLDISFPQWQEISPF